MGWEVHRNLPGLGWQKYLSAESKKHAEGLAKYHTSISIYEYRAVEVSDAQSVPATARRGQSETTATHAPAAQSERGGGHLEVSLSERDGVGTDAVGESRAESVGSPGPLPDDEADDNPPDTRTDVERINEGYYTYASAASAAIAENDDASESDESLPYVRDSETSKSAAGTMIPHVTRLRTRIDNYLISRGDRGATRDEISDALALRHQTTTARVVELMDAGYIYAEGTRPTNSGRMGEVLKAVIDRSHLEPNIPTKRARAIQAQMAIDALREILDIATGDYWEGDPFEAIAEIARKGLGEDDEQ